jgi:putative spermidine/putrescine transport system permease protein
MPTAQPTATRRRGGLASLALVPFAVIVLFFLVLPALSLLWGSFHEGGSGAPTLANYDYLRGADKSLQPFINSFLISFASMISGGILGLVIAQALVSSKNRVLEQLTITFSSVAANFAGVPLAFAYVAMIGVNGLITRFLIGLGVDLYGAGFSLYTLAGLTVVYTYFQVPLMVLLILPALQAMRREWREASDNLGASRWRYVRSVAIPVLTPSLIASLLLLFANSFGAYATAYALTTGFISLVPIAI